MACGDFPPISGNFVAQQHDRIADLDFRVHEFGSVGSGHPKMLDRVKRFL
jgi:hypothetical protein